MLTLLSVAAQAAGCCGTSTLSLEGVNTGDVGAGEFVLTVCEVPPLRAGLYISWLVRQHTSGS